MQKGSYQITNDPSGSVEEFLKRIKYSDIIILIDENTEQFCLPKLPGLSDQKTIKISAGEDFKTLDTCSQIWSGMTEAGLDRKALMINLGGGVIGDMGGFCASTYKRGIRFINLPTTLLSQVDASVGGKLGIDFEGLKNHIGVFNQPERVIIAPEFLETLSARELRSGFAEILKHGLIASNDHFEKARATDLENAEWIPLITDSVKIKEEVVEQDPTEQGLRKILNFGHTIGHAIETFYLNSGNRILHGEAIAIGMICESWLSHEMSGLTQSQFDSITDTLLRFYPKESTLQKVTPESLSLMMQDKKNLDGKILCTLLTEIGKASWDIEINLEQAENALSYYNSL